MNLPIDPTTHNESLPGDLRRVSCSNELHPIHVLQYNGEKWELMDDLHPVACSLIGVSMVIKGVAETEALAEQPE